MWQWADGDFVPCEGVPLTDRGFRYGLGLFETIRVRNGKPEFFQEHLRRLMLDSEAAGFASLSWDSERLKARIPIDFNGVLRIYRTAGDGSPVAGWAETEGRLLVTMESRSGDVESVRVVLNPEPVLPTGWKTLNYWQNLAAVRAAKANGADEALLWTWNKEGKKRLVGAGMANLFWLKNGKIFTPAHSCGARQGVVREWILRHYSVQECEAVPEILETTDGLFLTSSWLGIKPVSHLGQHALSYPKLPRCKEVG